MDGLTLVMFVFPLVLGFTFYVLGFTELREIFRGKEKGSAAPAMGTIYFFICFIVWLVLAMWWPAMATDAALATLGYLWLGFALLSFSFAIACIGFLLYSSVKKPESGRLEIREEREGF